MPIVSLFLTLGAASAADLACPATPDHIVGACGGCRPLFEDVANAGFDLDATTQLEVERCVRGSLGMEQRRLLTSAKACVAESAAVPDELGGWIVGQLDAAKRLDDPTRSAQDRQWAQCEAQIRHMDNRPSQCVVPEDVVLERVKHKGRSKVAMRLAFDNRCVRELACAVTVSASRGAPALDGVTGVEEVLLSPSMATVAPVKLRFPSHNTADLADWSVGGVACRYTEQVAIARLPDELDTSAATADLGD